MTTETDRRQTFIDSLFENEDFVRLLFDESGKKGGLEFCLGDSGNYRRLGFPVREIGVARGGERKCR